MTGEVAAPSPPERPSFVRSGDWWPGGMGHPNSVGSQNGTRYAYFARAKRIAIERDGVITLHDTQDHRIDGVSSQPSTSGSLRLSSQHGAVEVTSLPVVAGRGALPSSSPQP